LIAKLLGLPPDLSAHGPQIDALLGAVHVLMFALFVGWGGFFVYSLVRFRRKRNPKADYAGARTHASSFIEAGVAAFEAVLLIAFAIPVWATRINGIPKESDATVVRVVAEQFAWNVHYPGPDGKFGRTDPSLISPENPLGLDRDDPAAKDDITTINQLNVPVGKPVLVYLSTKDVIHSFSLPFFRVKQDAIPGQRIPVWFTPTSTTAALRETMARNYRLSGRTVPPELATLTVTRDYADGAGNIILSKGSLVTDDAVAQLRQAGINEVVAAPDIPTEIACAQLCGLGHYRMRGFIVVQTEDEFKAWLAEQASYQTQ
jgi:cytochrome c oxidase subunit II